MWFSGILSALLMVVVLIAKSFLINTLFGQIEADVWNYANTYLLFMAFSIPFIAIYNAGAAIYRTSGKFNSANEDNGYLRYFKCCR